MENNRTVVSFVKGEDIKRITRESISLIGGLSNALKSANKVLVKPNMGVDLPSSTGTTTNPVVVATLVELIKEAGVKRVLVGESAVVGYDAGKVFDMLGVRELFKTAGAEVVNLDADKSVKVKVPKGHVLDNIRIHRTAWECDFIISVPVMKTHPQTLVSLGMKNMKGTLPDSMKKVMHRIGVKEIKYEFELEHAIVDLISILKPNLTVIDGIIAQEGYKPGSPGIGGSPVEFNTVIAGFDPVATDAIAAYLMGFDPMEVRHIRLAFERGLGEARIQKIKLVGTPEQQVRKKFRSACLDDVQPQFGNIKLSVGKGCSGCREIVTLALLGMKPEEIAGVGEAELLIGQITEPFFYSPLKRKFLIGNCAKDLLIEGYRIPGCPPPSFYVKKSLKGEKIDW